MLCNAYGLIWCFVLKYGATALDFISQNNFNTSNLVKIEILPLILQQCILLILFLKPCKSNNWIIVNEVSKETIGITQHFAKKYISISQWVLILSAFKLK